MVDAILVPDIHMICCCSEQYVACLFGGTLPLGPRDILHGLIGFAISGGDDFELYE